MYRRLASATPSHAYLLMAVLGLIPGCATTPEYSDPIAGLGNEDRRVAERGLVLSEQGRTLTRAKRQARSQRSP